MSHMAPNTLSSHNIAVIIETLAHEAMQQGSPSAKQKLQSLYNPLSNILDCHNRGNFTMLSAVLAFLNGDYLKTKVLIENGKFEEYHYQFLRELYKTAEERMLIGEFGKMRKPKKVELWPESIDPKDTAGISGTVGDYIKNYFIRRRASKKAINAGEIAELTNLPEAVVVARLRDIRDEISLLSRPEQKCQKNSHKAAPPASLKIAHNPMEYYENLFPYLPSPPMFADDFFPTHRVPIDQPLSIIIPN